MSIEDKRDQICEVYFTKLKDVSEYIQRPWSKNKLHIKGKWFKVPCKDIEFSETQESKKKYKQEFKAILTDSSEAKVKEWTGRMMWRGILKMKYTSGKEIAFGSTDFPLNVAVSIEGIPSHVVFKASMVTPQRALTLSPSQE